MLLYGILVTIIIGFVFYFLRKRENLSSYVPWLKWTINIVSVTLNYWSFNKKYSDLANMSVRVLVLSELASADAELRDLREDVGAVVSDIFNVVYPTKTFTKQQKDIIISAYVATISYDNLRETVYLVVSDPKGLDLVKATLLVIDIMGELVNLEDKLGQQYFQHLVFGINKTLKLVKEDTNRSNKEAISTLFRVYKLTKAYNYQRELHDKTREQIYSGMVDVFGSALGTIGK